MNRRPFPGCLSIAVLALVVVVLAAAVFAPLALLTAGGAR